MELTVRVLSDDTLVVISDPNPWLHERLNEDCGAFLGSLAAQPRVPRWALELHRRYAAAETIAAYRPTLLRAIGQGDHLAIGGCDHPASAPASQSVWPQALREMRVPSDGPERDRTITDTAEVAYFSYLKLPFPLRKGERYEINDRWGGHGSVLFDPAVTVSWALKVDQVGYLPDAAEKYAYLGAWTGPTGPLDLARYEGREFRVVSDEDTRVALRGVVKKRSGEVRAAGEPLFGEDIYELDMSALREPGAYHVELDALGRSASFRVGQDAFGEAFYTHARGLFHARCAPLSPAFTPWARGDAHTATFRAAFPPDMEDYKDHAAEGWGFRDEQGAYVAYQPFQVVALTATEEPAAGVQGGWHDAADFDRRGLHMIAVADLAHAYLLTPENFTDGQLHIPESGNGTPDLLDEAAFGIDPFRRSQQADGRVSTWVEATSHPRVADPGRDPQPYYTSLATRNGSLRYAAVSALLSQALARAGQPERAEVYRASARRAYAFGSDPAVHVTHRFEDHGKPRTFTEPPAPDRGLRFWALVELWLSTDDARYRAELESPAMAEAFHKELNEIHWRGSPFDMTALALAPERFPKGWGDEARKRLLAIGEEWLAWQKSDPYRKAWYPPAHAYFRLMGWGNNEFAPLRFLVAAWRISGEPRFRTGALLGVDWLHGGNPQGRVNTTGLGSNFVVAPLHLPSTVDDLDEPVPGITIFGYTGLFPFSASARVYGLFHEPRRDFAFEGTSLAALPPPWDGLPPERAKVAALLPSLLPIWRRVTTLENENPPVVEFSVYETIAPATAITGCLLGPGWMPSAALLARKPRTEVELKDSLLYQP